MWCSSWVPGNPKRQNSVQWHLSDCSSFSSCLCSLGNLEIKRKETLLHKVLLTREKDSLGWGTISNLGTRWSAPIRMLCTKSDLNVVTSGPAEVHCLEWMKVASSPFVWRTPLLSFFPTRCAFSQVKTWKIGPFWCWVSPLDPGFVLSS